MLPLRVWKLNAGGQTTVLIHRHQIRKEKKNQLLKQMRVKNKLPLIFQSHLNAEPGRDHVKHGPRVLQG